MTRLYFVPALAALAALALSLPLTASGQNRTVTLEPGLYDFTHKMTVNGQTRRMEDYEYCIREGRNSKSFDEIVAEIMDGGQCTASSLMITQSTGSARVSCTDPDFGITYTGDMEAEYGADYYNVDATARVNGMPITVKTRVKRRSACPAGWNNPDNVSAD